jgi:hypothetical protein
VGVLAVVISKIRAVWGGLTAGVGKALALAVGVGTVPASSSQEAVVQTPV